MKTIINITPIYKRVLSFAMTLLIVITMLPAFVINVKAAGVPSALRVGSILSERSYTSAAIGGAVSIRDIPVSFNDNSSSFGFCYKHNASLTAHTTGYRWVTDGTAINASSSAASPFLAHFYYNLAQGTWNDWERELVSSWVQVALWMSQTGQFNDYNNATQLRTLAEERVAVLKLLGISTVTVDESLTLFYQIISSYEGGTYGSLTAYVYYFDDDSAGMQPVFVGFLESSSNFPVFIKLSKTLEGSSGYFSGATFGLYADPSCSEELGRLTTTSSQWNTSNQILINAESATLYVKEISSGDASVTKNSGVFSVNISASANGTAATAAAVVGDGADGSIVNTTVTPPPSGPNIVIQKIDGASGAGLCGAVFKLEGNATSGGYVSTNVTSAADGTVTLQWSDPAGENYIAPGEYTVTETKAPAGYEKSDEARHLRLWLEDDGGSYIQRSSGTLVFENFKQHSVVFRKVSESGAGLAGAVFDVFRNGTKLGSYTTGGGGTITISNVTTGYYEFVETTPPAGYLLPVTTSAGVYVDTTDSTVTEHYLTMTNFEYPEIVIQKLDSVTNLPLAGTTFEVMIDGAVLGTFTTTSTGRITINYAQYKDYLTDGNEVWTVTVTEVSAPDGYFGADPVTQTNQLKKGQALSAFSFKNQPYPDVVVHKTDSKTGEPLGGVTFTLEGVSSGASYVQTTSADGIATFSKVPEDTYTLSETAVPPGYRLSDKTYTVVVEPGCDQVFDYYYANDRLPNLTLRKVDSITADVLEGVAFKFEYRDTSGGAYEDMGTFYTDENGEICLTDLPVGWWKATEVEPPHGYQLDPSTGESQEFYLDGNEDRVITFKNTPLSAIIIYKTDTSDQSTPLFGAVFELRYLGGDTSGSGGTTIGRYTTSVNGTAVITGLKRGYYIVEEIIPPEHHTLSSESIQTVFISGNDQDIMTVTFRNQRNPDFLLIKRDASDKSTPLPGAVYKITDSGGGVIGDNNGLFETSSDGTISIYNLDPNMTLLVQEVSAPDGYVLDSKVYTAKLDGSGAYELILYNEPQKDFVLIKLDGSDKKTPLPGVEYYITFANGSIVPGGENGYFKTDSAGKITLTGLKTGDVLKIQETKTKDDSYILDGTVHTYTIESGSNSKTFYNERKGGFLLIKRDASSNALLSGVQYKITYADGTFVGSSNGIHTTDANGEIRIIQSFEPGATLIATEVKAKDGYLLDDTVHTITIKNPDTLYTITAYNTPIGGVEVTKVDANSPGTRIPNIEFELRHMNGAYVGKYMTDKNGRFFVALEPGWYTLLETDTGKSGYILDPTPINFEVVEGKTTTLTVKNEAATRILLHKTDSVTGKGIYNAKFLLMDRNQNPIMIITTDQDGYAYIDASDELHEGKYFLKELENKGYVLDEQIKTVYLEAGKTTLIEWQNTPEMGQIQVIKYSQDHNTVTGTPAGTLLQGAVFEISEHRSGKVVGYITTDARGVAASGPLPLGRYIVRETTAPQFYQVSAEKFDVDIEYAGQIIKLSAYNKSAFLGTTISKKGNIEVIAGDSMRYDIYSIANASNVPLSDFYWCDKIPVEAAHVTSMTTGTYSQRLYYRVVFKTNLNDYRVLASNLLTTNNYSFNLSQSTLGLMAGEVVTEMRLEFGTVESGFHSVKNPTITVKTLSSLSNGYQFTNTAEVGGYYRGAWEGSQAKWVTKIVKYNQPNLPKTGY